MRRSLLICLLLGGCSLQLPADPVQSGVVPACSANSVLENGQCVGLDKLTAGHAASATRADTADTAASAASVDQADHADLAQWVPPGSPLLLAPGAPPTTVGSYPLTVSGGEIRIDSGRVFAHLGSFITLAPSTTATLTSGGVTIPLVTASNHAAAQFTTGHAGTVRIRAFGDLIGTGSSTSNPPTFTNCVVLLEVVDGGGNGVAGGVTNVSAWNSTLSPPRRTAWFIEKETPLAAGTYTVTAILGVAGSNVASPSCSVGSGRITIQVDGT